MNSLKKIIIESEFYNLQPQIINVEHKNWYIDDI